MAYENYNFVSWSDGSPLSSNRLGQMSINIEQVKDVVDDKAQGVLRLVQAQSQFPNSSGYFDFIEHEILYLKDQSGEVGGSDNRVTVAENRYYKITVNIPSITIKDKGAEDSIYTINIYEGNSLSDTNSLGIGGWQISPHPFGFFDVASNANTLTTTAKATQYDTKIAAGTFSLVQPTTTGFTNKSFYCTVGRVLGSNSLNAPGWIVEGNSTYPVQFYVEDVGGL